MRHAAIITTLILVALAARSALASPQQAKNGSFYPLLHEVVGDFNGDGTMDQARLELTDDGRTLLIVEMEGQSYILEENSNEFLGLYVDTLEPGTYATACAKGYGDPCKADELRSVTLVHTGLLYGKEEASAQLWYWTGAGFSKVWLTD